MAKISSREKNLLVVLVLVAIIACGFMFVIRPILNVKQEQKTTITQLEQENAQTKALVDQVPTLEATLKKKKELIDTEQTKFYQPMQTWEAERLVTNITKKHQVTVNSITEANAVPYVPVVPGQAPDPNKKVDSAADIITVSVEFTSTLDGLKGMINEIATSNRKIAVQSWKYAIKEGQLTGTVVVELYVLR